MASAGQSDREVDPPTPTRTPFVMAVYCAQFFFGGWFVAHGINHWIEFFPRPQGSSPIGRELIMALNQSGLFDLIKILEVVTGVLMLANRLVPLAVIMAFPVAAPIAYLLLVVNPDMLSKISGVLILAILSLVAAGHLKSFLPLFVFNHGDPDTPGLRGLRSGNPAQATRAMPWAAHALAILAGLAAPVAITFWTSSFGGTHSNASAPPSAGNR